MAIRAAANLGISVDVIVADRRHLTTTVVATATDAFGNVLPPERRRFLSTSDQEGFRTRFQVDMDVSPGCQQQLWQYGACIVSWNVAAYDDENRLLFRRREVITYNTDRPMGECS